MPKSGIENSVLMGHESFLIEYQNFSAQASRSLLTKNLMLVYEINQE